MSSVNIYDVIESPLVTEKSTILSEQNKVVFNVLTTATKVDVKNAVEKIFKVKVKKVNTVNTKGKVKRFKGVLGKRKDTRKAIVTLHDGETIDISAGA